MINEYIVDFTVEGPSGQEYQSSMDILANNVEMAEVIFYDALSQEFPDGEYALTDVGTYEHNK